jgi:hypothetical protein
MTLVRNPLEKKADLCPICGSDRKTTRITVGFTTADGQPAGSGPCPNSWHDIQQSDGRIGGGTRTPSPTRSRFGF